jgi:Sec-independent protein translocase protein TatA
MGFQEIVVILLVAMIALGPAKIVEFSKKLGQFSRDVKQTSEQTMNALKREIEEEQKQKNKEPDSK